MKRTALSTLCLILILTAQSYAQSQISAAMPETKESSRFDAEWRLRLAGSDVHDERSQSKVVDIRTDIKAKYLLSRSLQLDIQPSLRLQSGQTQSVDGADRAENKIILNQAAAHYLPFSALRLSAGALNQRHMHTNLLVDGIAFPAARLEALMKAGLTKTSLSVESAIPTSTSLSTNTKELEKTPSLNTAALKFQMQAAQNLFWKSSVGYFMYNNLPSAVAQQSNLLGNEVEKLSEAQYAFMYKYEGIEAATEFEFPVFSLFDFRAGGEYLQNTKAPSDQNTATRYFAAGEFHFGKNTDLVIEGSYFSIAPEAAVAYFNAGGFETNRVGYSAESYLSFKKEGFNIGVKYTDSEVMFNRDPQSREKTLMIKLETFYANI
ncbi:hypothetical protein [Bdellovibrio bacteriovorus]|uniref:hypothetical protein n=1 Tax=Bdellovibrio bacteriovorus TaxID=959 RepID=UPI00045BE3AC|nr:hypothetical protein [Bdellovibrio bacteriovorus]AHZ84908.1 hypothetical protein EP01_08155 [Bdellovibrio bacteriovorus]